MRILSYFVLLIIILIGLTFAALNSNVVSFNYYLGIREVALSLLLVFTFGLGIFLGLLGAVFPWIRAKRDAARVKARLKTVEKELENLRVMPIKDE